MPVRLDTARQEYSKKYYRKRCYLSRDLWSAKGCSIRAILIIIPSTHYLFSNWPSVQWIFRNQHLGRHLTADYTIIMSRTLKVMGNHVMYDRGAWFLRVIMSSSRALCCLPSVKKQKHDFQVFFVDLARHRKSSWRQGLTNTKRSTKVAKELFADYVKAKKLREPEEKKELAQTLKTFYVEGRKKGFVQRIIKQLLDSVFVISRIIRVSVSGW